eukprot:gnl/TRDRNA2_/TRDRNA2_185273_c0_seq1.p1 gnl/TRDRNA2_/TRDRNA2_185273_c0~~gnl/TRDRNA2_/TRDRNA2_185273_c0_seq1.p1  ORF type:complete len:316 (-),score=60.32 gnl/TRDRNA2_/TRDRNA2_185273_c0_seq1:268-1215(-)
MALAGSAMKPRSASVTPADCARTPAGSSRRCASADHGLDMFHFPDGTEWSLPSAWCVKEYLLRCPKSFKTYAYRTLEPGDRWVSEEGCETFEVPEGLVRDDLLLKSIQKPMRTQPTQQGWFVEQERLFSVLRAMIAGKPLPPIRVATDAGEPSRVMNGFHRYYASLLLGYTEIPVVREGISAVPASIEEEENSEEDGPIVTFENEDGSITSSMTCVLAPKKPATAPVCNAQTKCRHRGREHCLLRQKAVRWEPPAKRREREEREEQERQAKLKRDMAKALREDIMSRETRNRALAAKMRSPPVSYAQATAGGVHR